MDTLVTSKITSKKRKQEMQRDKNQETEKVKKCDLLKEKRSVQSSVWKKENPSCGKLAVTMIIKMKQLLKEGKRINLLLGENEGMAGGAHEVINLSQAFHLLFVFFFSLNSKTNAFIDFCSLLSKD